MDNSNCLVTLLRDPDTFFASVRRSGTPLPDKWLAAVSVVCLALVGFVMGLGHGGWQALSSAVKLPVLVIGTGLLCLPALYLLSLAFGSRLEIAQVVTVVLAGVAVSSLVLAGLLPVMLVFLSSGSYPFFQLLAVASVTLGSLVGVYYLWRGVERVHLFERAPANLRRGLMNGWFILYAFVGSQMAWRLSPFVGDPQQPFVWLQPSHDNLFVDVLRALESATSLQLSAVGLQPMVIGTMCLVPLVLLLIGVGLVAGSESA
jgi:hypothetical protein